jgi:hypothetical protein
LKPDRVRLDKILCKLEKGLFFNFTADYAHFNPIRVLNPDRVGIGVLNTRILSTGVLGEGWSLATEVAHPNNYREARQQIIMIFTVLKKRLF